MESGAAGAQVPNRSRTFVLYGLVGIALSLVLTDLVRHWVDNPAARYGVVFFPLWVALALRDQETPQRSRAGYALLGLALVLVLVSSAGGNLKPGRVAIPIAILGVSRAFGLVGMRQASLTFWIVPLPTFVSQLLGPYILDPYWKLAARGARAFGSELERFGTEVVSAGLTMESSTYDAGFALVALLTGLGWYAALNARCGLPQAAARALRWGLAAVPIQLACLVVASIALLAGAPRAGRLLLDQAWIPVAVAGIAIAHRSAGLGARSAD